MTRKKRRELQVVNALVDITGYAPRWGAHSIRNPPLLARTLIALAGGYVP